MNDESLTYKPDADMLRKLYPSLDYDKSNKLEHELNPIEKQVSDYEQAPVKPYIAIKNLNQDETDVCGNIPIGAIETGLKFSF